MRHFRIGVFVLALAAAGLFMAALLQAQQPAPTTPQVSARATTLNGQPVGEVLVGDTVVVRIRGSVGGFTEGERAQIVASRLQNALAQGHTWEELRTERAGNQYIVYLGTAMLVTADPRAARLQGMTAPQLASQWQGNLQTALRAVGGPVVAGAQESWPAWTNVGNKIVPIVSAGSPGVRLGAAQVIGPQERINQVEAVFQVDLEFQRAARARVFIPSSSLTGLNRVQGTAVSALLQYELFRF
ncbi:MAG TPA: hypothetical protein PLZ36_07915 [Armatimonadota bacterium]|nr:hypothetical protein [Armatimonadota bacterium]